MALTVCLTQERLECSKRGWELQHLQKLKVEEQERQTMEADEELFTYTREDAYNMVGGPRGLGSSGSAVWILTLFSLCPCRSMCLMQRMDTQKSCR